MKYLLISLLFVSCCGTKSQPAKTAGSEGNSVETATSASTTTTGNVALYFGSMASGPIGDEFLKTWLQKFIQDEQVAVSADKFSACGKEGEYIIVINKLNFDAATEARFNAGLQKVINDAVEKAKAQNNSSGSVEIRPNPKVEEYSYCRLGSKKWL